MEFAIFLGAHNLGQERSATELYEDMTEQALLAEELGFSMIWLVEHHFNDYNLMTDPIQFAVRIFERTRRIRAGAAVIILPNHHPLQLAGRLAQLDVLYPGRFETAVGRGSSGYEAVRMETAMDPETSRDHFFEHLEVMTKAFQCAGDHGHQGRFFRHPDLTLLPRPVTQPNPALWLAGVTPSSIYWQVINCHKLGIPVRVITSPFRQPFDYVAEGHGEFRRALAEVGTGRDAARFAVNRTMFVGETRDQAEAALPYLLRIHRGLYRQLEGTEVYRDGKTELGEIAAEHEVSGEEVFANTPFGDVAHVRDHVRHYHELGIDQLSCYFDFGLPQDIVLASMRRFAENVMLEFAD